MSEATRSEGARAGGAVSAADGFSAKTVVAPAEKTHAG
jgi:hypothetical protein